MTTGNDRDGAGLVDCRYVQSLATLERLTGCTLTTDLLASKAAECAGQQCSFAARCRTATQLKEAPAPVPFPARGRDFRHRNPRVGFGGEKVAFSREAAADVAVDGSGNRVERRTLAIERRRDSPSLDQLFGYWQWLRRATEGRLKDVDVAHVMRAGVIGRLHIVNVVSSDPQDFAFDLAGYALPLIEYKKPCAHPVRIYADCTLRDYNTVRMTAVAQLQRIRARVDGVGLHYTRLILPLMGNRGRVSHLMVAVEREAGDGMRTDPAQEFAGISAGLSLSKPYGLPGANGRRDRQW
jgi:hypothetical protein